MKFIVGHAYYGCETGCCGHVVEVKLEPGEVLPRKFQNRMFDFTHPYGEDQRAFAEQMVRSECGEEHVKDLDWDNCYVLDE